MKGDFLGFSFDGIHSSRLGITRVSDGDRYNESLVPEIEDKIVPVPGENGSYFFGSLYRTKPITVQIAFDSLTESQFRQLRKLLAIKKPCKLIFDERPYKVYTAKISAPPQLNYICFDEEQYFWEDHSELENNGGYIPKSIDHKLYTGRTQRIYKGEGTIEFECIYPYAVDQFKVLDLYGNFDFKPTWGIGVYYKNNPRTIGEAQERIAYDTEHAAEGEVIDENDPKYTVIEIDSGNTITIYDNTEDWAESSGILPYEYYKKYHVDSVYAVDNVVGYNACIPVYNAGDVDAPFYLYLPFGNGENIEITADAPTYFGEITVDGESFKTTYPYNGVYTFYYSDDTWHYGNDEINLEDIGITYSGAPSAEPDAVNKIKISMRNTIDSGSLTPASGNYIDINVDNQLLRLKPFESSTTLNKENGVIINTNNHLIEGVVYDMATSTWRTTGNLYNEYIVAGDFVKIKANDWTMFDTYDGSHTQTIYLNCATALDARIHYNYLYY